MTNNMITLSLLIFCIVWLGLGVLAAVWYTRLLFEYRASVRECPQCLENYKNSGSKWYSICATHKNFDDEYWSSALVLGGLVSFVGMGIYVLLRAVAVSTEKKISLRKELEKECQAAEAMIDDLLKKEATP